MIQYRAFLLLIALAQLSVTLASKNIKRGLAFADGDTPGNVDIKKANTSSSVVSWQYNWGATPPDYLSKSGIPFIPMQWGTSGIANFASIVKAQGAKTILGFNEPDLSSQSNINATYAATLWKQYINPLSNSGVRLGAPAVSSGSTGLPWLSAFLAACSGCTIDFIPLHWYGTGAQNFNKYIGQVHTQFPGRPLWVTEFASTSLNDTEVYNFMVNTTSYMDSLSWIEGYSWFAFLRKQSGSAYNLMDAHGSLTTLGANYIN
ncbi:glycoside hydrolase family 128 protein [Hypholoma sublateritium FD-334 SS-4]|uniref:Glycoside hydrolase family 128 protein n=1 Tax=Hypholoma sublateritium (strain FD-334 SS-4) TaxID=945553 RepID=A0A0D2NWS2_HYPSF|nr:glycoside hydrolase family 128 protein [Hypholoma sublateritium FD-334 SS-4]